MDGYTLIKKYQHHIPTRDQAILDKQSYAMLSFLEYKLKNRTFLHTKQHGVIVWSMFGHFSTNLEMYQIRD